MYNSSHVSVLLPPFFGFFFLRLLFIQSTSAEITLQPVSINTTLNSTANFVCEANGDLLNFLVNNTPANEIRARGFMDDTTGISGGGSRGNLTAKAYDINNNTNISCVASTLSPPSSVTSDTVFLTIQGLLDNVGNLNHIFINGSTVLLTWTAPYTLDNVPITGYHIVNGSVNITTTNKSITLSATNPDPCILNNISVSPINDVGIGSSNNISFHYETVPLVAPNVSVIPAVNEESNITLNISINVSSICKGEYPNSITVIILNTDNAIIHNTSIVPQINDQLMIVTGTTGSIMLPATINVFIVNLSLSNNGGTFNDVMSFTFGFLGPVTNIDSSIDNCSTIDITWNAPTVDDGVSIQYYKLRLYDAINGSLVKTDQADATSYQFVDVHSFIHRYTYVITGVNELGEGIFNNDTFFYQRIPRSVTEAGSDIIVLTFNETSATASYNIPVTLECTGEAPENVTVTIQCEAGFLYFTNDAVEYPDEYTYRIQFAHEPVNITRSVSGIPLFELCNMTIVFINEAGSSEPFIKSFDTTPIAPSVHPTPSPTINGSVTPTTTTLSPSSTVIIRATIGCVAAVLILIAIILIIVVVIYWYMKKRNNDKNLDINKKIRVRQTSQNKNKNNIQALENSILKMAL